MKDNQARKAWAAKNAVDYYLRNRDKSGDLYKSEKYFIEDVLKRGKTLLDIGCATGGFLKIVREYNKNIRYTGADISSAMIREAQKRFPKEKFYLCDGIKLDFPDGSFDICMSFGVLHMTENWKELLAEAWRVCRDKLIFDLRITEEEGICDAKRSYQRLEFGGEWDGVSRVPYVVVNLGEAVEYMADLKPKIKSVKSYGYWHPVSGMTVSKYDKVCMSVFCLEKKAGRRGTDWQLPLNISDGIKKRLAA